ncbi:hypothetical protein S101395_02907 [Bacillus sonorensis]|nr:hypothetical protein S101395_02907 [Bacillus sonorensis]
MEWQFALLDKSLGRLEVQMNTLSFYNKKKDKWEDIYTVAVTDGKNILTASELFERLKTLEDEVAKLKGKT